MENKWKYLLTFLSLTAALVWLAAFSFPDKNLHLIACDVGEGDAILAIYKKTQVLIDGGPGSKVMECLSKYMPFWDRKIEAIILTHPQSDHLTGLIEVFKSYQVENFLVDPLDTSSQGFGVLKSLVGGSGVKVINPTSGMVLRYDLIQLDILHPSKEFLAKNLQPENPENNIAIQQFNASYPGVLGAYTSSLDLNEFSVVTILSFGNFDALLTGDMDNKISNIIAESGVGRVEYIKIPHHGSKNGLTKNVLDAVKPELAVISVGKNSYGHPNEEILKMLNVRNIKILRTDEMGNVVVESDGKGFWVKN